MTTEHPLAHIDLFANLILFYACLIPCRYANEYVYPSVDKAFSDQQRTLLEEMKRQQDEDDTRGLSLAVDCRFSRPGYTATYGVTSAMCLDTGKIFATVVKSKTDIDVASSSGMETVGTKAVLKGIMEPWTDDCETSTPTNPCNSPSGSPSFCLPAPSSNSPSIPLRVDLLVTDENAAVMGMVRKEFPYLRHEADPWHLRKSIMKRLHKEAKKKVNEPLGEWLPSIRNWLWTAMKECRGDGDLLVELWRSTRYHVLGQHSWETDETFSKFKKCAHGNLSNMEIGYLPSKSKAYESLASVVNDPKIHGRLRRCTLFAHTSCLESFHSLLCKYVPKDLKFGATSFETRVRMAVLDWNENAGRDYKKNKRGERIVTFEHPASVNEWRARWRRSERSTNWSNEIVQNLPSFTSGRWASGHVLRRSEAALVTHKPLVSAYSPLDRERISARLLRNDAQ